MFNIKAIQKQKTITPPRMMQEPSMQPPITSGGLLKKKGIKPSMSNEVQPSNLLKKLMGK